MRQSPPGLRDGLGFQSYREKTTQARCLAKSALVLKGSVMSSPREEAVLRAADDWVNAMEALVAARNTGEGTGVEARQDAADLAGVRLVLAVKSWRSGGDPAEELAVSSDEPAAGPPLDR